MSWLTNVFIPHRYCLGNDWLVWVHVISDAVIFLSYMGLSGGLWYFKHHRGKAPFGYIFNGFAWFIFACGCTHLMGIIVQWYPIYRVDALVKIWCAVLSACTLVITILLMPIALKVNSIIWEFHDTNRLKDLQDMIVQFERLLHFPRKSHG